MRLALLGDPVSHSRSPSIHRAAFAAFGLVAQYEALRCDEAGLAEACLEIRSGQLHGANVTMPLKGAASVACDRVVGRAVRASAVNTLLMDGDSLCGYNTDIVGIERLLERFHSLPVTVMGTGGSAAAALVAAEGREIAVVGRDRAKAAALIARTGVEAAIGSWERPSTGSVLINATTLGMKGEALPVEWLMNQAALIDLPYGPDPTPAVVEGQRLGIGVADGIDALVAQAVASFELWTGLEAPVAAMEAAARA